MGKNRLGVEKAHMRILIDYTQIPVERAGVGNYAYNLINELSSVDLINQYFILIQDDDNSFSNIANNKFTFLKINHSLFRKLFFRFLLEQLFIPFLIIFYRINIIHSLHYSFPVLRLNAKRIVMIHDMTFFLFPKMHQIFKRFYFRFFIKLATLLKSRIICISKSTLYDLIKITGVKKEKCSVVYLGKSDQYKPNIDKKKLNEVKKKFNITGDYILFIGTIEPRKNIESIIIAHSELINKRKIKLVIAGKMGWYYAEIFVLINKLGTHDDVIFTGYVKEEKPYLLSGCSVFIYPSVYEGFGLPVLEAMASGVPVITSNISSMPEITGQSALLLNDPKDINEIVKCIELILKDKKMAGHLIKSGIKQASQFTWNQTAIETLKIYNSLA